MPKLVARCITLSLDGFSAAKEGLDRLSDGYEVAEYIPSKAVAHVRIVKKAK
jgi:hypothetical protein